MKIKRTLVLFTVLVIVCMAFAACGAPDKLPDAPKVTELWSLQDQAAINNPESAWYDETRKCIWVVNTTDSASPDSFISKLSLDGKVIESNFLGGFIGLRGTYLKDNYLYTNTVNSLLKINLDTKEYEEYKAEGAVMLNDIAMDSKGNVFVTDIQGDTIYTIGDGKLVSWITDKEGLEWPNGILVIGDTMYLSPWGIGDETWTVPYQSSVKTINMATKEIKKLGAAAEIGSLDGIESYDANNLLVSNWWNGKVYMVNRISGEAQQILDGGLKSTGDINYNQNAKILLVPIGNAAEGESHQIKAYKIG